MKIVLNVGDCLVHDSRVMNRVTETNACIHRRAFGPNCAASATGNKTPEKRADTRVATSTPCSPPP